MGEIGNQAGSVFRKDFFWYLLSTAVPVMVGFIKTPVFTRYFDREEFGQLGLVTISFAFLGMLLYSWINSCIWRFYNRYKASSELQLLYSNLIVLYLLSTLISAGFTVIWLLTTKSELVRELVLFSFIQLVLNQLYMACMVIIRLMKRSRYFTLFQSVRSVAGLALALLLVFYFHSGITALVSSLAVVDLLAIAILVVRNPIRMELRWRGVRKTVIIELLRYGGAGLVLNLSLLSISYVDRYIIALFYDLGSVGIYDQVTRISQLSVMSLITVYFNTINPVLFKKLEHDFTGSVAHVKSYMFTLMMLGIPLVFYMSLLSREMAYVLLGPEFREGYKIMPFIFWSALLYGIAQFYELRLKFSGKIRKMGIIALVTAVVNIGLNLILVRWLGYEWAAYTTLASYFTMLVLLVQGDGVLSALFLERKKVFLKMLLLFTAQFTFFYLYIVKMDPSFTMRLGLGVIFALTFFWYFKKTVLDLNFPTN